MKYKRSKRYEGESIRGDKGENVGIDLHQLAQRPTGPLTSRPDRGPSPRRGWWALVTQPIKRRWGLTAQVTRFAAATVPHLKTLTRSERGLQRREAPPRHHRSAVTTATSLHCTTPTPPPRCLCTARRCLAQNFTDEPVVALDKGKSPFDLHSSRSS